MRNEDIIKFWTKVSKTEACWNWTAGRSGGYGMFRVSSGNHVLAHRFAFEMLRGPIPSGVEIDHLCRNRACVNPLHMELVTKATNLLRGEGACAKNKRKYFCNRGHPLSEENVYIRPGYNWRSCRACQLERSRNYRNKKKQNLGGTRA